MGNPSVSIVDHLFKLIAARGLVVFWVKSGPREDGENDAANCGSEEKITPRDAGGGTRPKKGDRCKIA